MAKKIDVKEVLTRLILGLVSGIILWLLAYVILILILVNFIIVIFKGKSEKAIIKISNFWIKEFSIFIKYILFESNEKSFPFSEDENIL